MARKKTTPQEKQDHYCEEALNIMLAAKLKAEAAANMFLEAVREFNASCRVVSQCIEHVGPSPGLREALIAKLSVIEAEEAARGWYIPPYTKSVEVTLKIE